MPQKYASNVEMLQRYKEVARESRGRFKELEVEDVKKLKSDMATNPAKAVSGYPLSDMADSDTKAANAVNTVCSVHQGRTFRDGDGVGTVIFRFSQGQAPLGDCICDQSFPVDEEGSIENQEEESPSSSPSEADLDARVPWENSSEAGKYLRGQISAYAAMSMHMTFRSHLFSIQVAGPYM